MPCKEIKGTDIIMGITKNVQTEENIRRMAKAAFPEKEVTKTVELTEGCCNVTYKVWFSDGSISILKIASAGGQGLMSNEVGLMDAEVRAMERMENHELVKVPKVKFYDKTKTLCSGDYFFMECLEGENFFLVQDAFTEDEKASFYREVGRWIKEISAVKGDFFGQLGDNIHKYSSLFELVYRMISNALKDGERKQVEIGVPTHEILERLKKDEKLFDEVKEPVLVHYDLWDGNFFTKEKRLCGFIDWERALWGEPLMEDRFRRHSINNNFLEGFGKTEFTEKEMRRIYWYDVLLYLTMMIEGTYREYPDDGQYRWVRPLFEASYGELTKEETCIS